MQYLLNNWKWIFIGYLILINIIGLLTCYIDKKKAQKHKWRIPEKQIFITAIIGGSLGILLGMYQFRHKTQHTKFVIGIPVILACQIVFLLYLLRITLLPY